MIQLSLFSFLALLEILAVLLVLLGIMVWRMRVACQQNRIQFIDAGDGQPSPSLYLDAEAARTRTFVSTLRDQPKTEPAAPTLRAALAARAGLLRYESEQARHPVKERDAAAWTALAIDVDSVLKGQGYTTEPAITPVYGEDDGTVREAIVVQQTNTIKHLREYIQQLLEKLGHQQLPDPGVTEHLEDLERANRELNQCVVVLEDENSFLRDQIAALLKLEPGASIHQGGMEAYVKA